MGADPGCWAALAPLFKAPRICLLGFLTTFLCCSTPQLNQPRCALQVRLRNVASKGLALARDAVRTSSSLRQAGRLPVRISLTHLCKATAQLKLVLKRTADYAVRARHAGDDNLELPSVHEELRRFFLPQLYAAPTAPEVKEEVKVRCQATLNW